MALAPVALDAGDTIEAALVTHGIGARAGGLGLIGPVANPASLDPDTRIQPAALAAAESDVAVVVVGLTDEQETEGRDMTTLSLPGRQDDLVFAPAAASRRTVVVVNAATPVLMPWKDSVDSSLLAGIPAQEAGHAVASALPRLIEPAERLVTSFPREDHGSAAWSVTPRDGALHYREGTFVGYRGHFAGRAPEPAYWFGHGLGCSTWSHGEPQLRVAVSRTVRRNRGDEHRFPVEPRGRAGPPATTNPARTHPPGGVGVSGERPGRVDESFSRQSEYVSRKVGVRPDQDAHPHAVTGNPRTPANAQTHPCSRIVLGWPIHPAG